MVFNHSCYIYSDSSTFLLVTSLVLNTIASLTIYFYLRGTHN